MKETLIDIETYCEADIKKCGLYRYVSDPSFEILLIAWAADEGSGFGETRLVDLASGEPFPQELLDDFKDSKVTLIAHNAAFERVSFSRYLQQQYPGQYLEPGAFLSPDRWICTMVMAASLTLPMALKDVGEVLRTTQQKDEEGKRLIKLFSAPCKPTKSNGGRTRNLPHHLPEDWAKFKYYCIQDVNTEVDIYKRLKRFPMPAREWHHYRVNERINDRGVRIDTELVQQAITCDLLLSDAMTTKAYELTGLENPNSVSQLKTWLDERGITIPFVQSIHTVSNKQQDKHIEAQIWGEASDKTPVYAADVIVTYQVLPEKSAWLYANVSDTKNLVGDELVASAIKSAMAELGPNEVTNRTKIEPLAQQKLAESLNQKYGEGAVFINKVVINNMDFEEAYNTAIQQKSIAQQNADKQKIENEAAIAKAEADKQVAITNAEAEAQKTSIAADAQSEANRKIAESLSDTLIEYQKIQKWDGKLPTVSGSNALVSIDPAE